MLYIETDYILLAWKNTSGTKNLSFRIILGLCTLTNRYTTVIVKKTQKNPQKTNNKTNNYLTASLRRKQLTDI